MPPVHRVVMILMNTCQSIRRRDRHSDLIKKQIQPLITSTLAARNVNSTRDSFRKYSSVVNTLEPCRDSNSDSDTGSSSSVSQNFSDHPDDASNGHEAAVDSGMPKRGASPFRTFKRISDQESAVLDYHNQFRKGDVEKARKKSEARVSKSKRRTRKRKQRKKGAPRKRKKLN